MSLSEKELRKVKLRKYLFGDFDHDGVKNVDDPKPFDSKVSKHPDHYNQPGHYHKAQFGGDEVLLSDELLALERNNNQRVPLLKAFLRRNPGSYGRVKTVPSTMKKLRERYVNQIGDIAGATLLTKDRKEANKKAALIRKHNTFDPNKTDDYYSKPKGDVYYAHHIGLIDRHNKDVFLEVQVKSKKMAEAQLRMHKDYKRGIPLNSYKHQMKKLFEEGF